MSKSAKAASTKRLRKELRRIQDDPIPLVTARATEKSLFKWFFVLEGPEETPFEGGHFLGHLEFPPNYPFAGPELFMHTPSGRFECGKSICLNGISAHHSESWSPLWSISTILAGFLSFFVESNVQTLGALQTTDEEKQALAQESLKWNVLHAPQFKSLFPELLELHKSRDQGKAPAAAAAAAVE